MLDRGTWRDSEFYFSGDIVTKDGDTLRVKEAHHSSSVEFGDTDFYESNDPTKDDILDTVVESMAGNPVFYANSNPLI